jgi:hypothetical protein
MAKHASARGSRALVILLAGIAVLARPPAASAGGPMVHNITQVVDYFTIQDAINGANDDDVITIDPGTFPEQISFLGKAITVRSTTLDPDDVIITGNNVGPIVTFNSGEGSGSVLQAVTVQFGHAVVDGGGILIDGSSPTITNCGVKNCQADGKGGGVAVVNGSEPTFTDVFVHESTSPNEGGGMFVGATCTVEIEGGGFFVNFSNGGGAINSGGTVSVTNAQFKHNSANFDGGAINSQGGILNLIGCHFHNNQGFASVGSAVTSLFNNTASLTNCTFAGNPGNFNGGFDSFNSTATITNCIFWGDTPGEILHQGTGTTTVNWSDVQGGWGGPGANNIDADPLFVNPSGDDAQLLFGSPCINAGNDGAPGVPPLDYFGNPRIRHCRIDLGFAETDEIGADCNGNVVADACDIEQDTYAIDDGTMENAFSFATPNHTIANQYDAGGGRVIGAIAVAFNDSMQQGDPVTVYLWDDPNNDGLPADAVLLASAGGVIGASSINNAKLGTAIFDVFPITPTAVSGSFFVGAATSTGGFPATIDSTAPVLNRGWMTSALGTINGAQVVIGGNLMVRARFSSDANANDVPDSCENPEDFGAPQEFIAFGEPGVHAVGDLDGNGTIDVLAVIPDPNPLNNGAVQVLLNGGVDGLGKWQGLTPLAEITVGRAPSGAAVGTFNGDLHLDLAVTNAGDDTVTILLNNGSAIFTPVGTVPSGGDGPSSIIAAQLNDSCDLLVDLAVTNEFSNTVNLLFGDGLGGFSPTNPCLAKNVAPIAVSAAPRAMNSGDFDGNKCPDLVGGSVGALSAAGVQPGIVFVLLSNGDGTFQAPAFYPVGEDPRDLAVADLNLDTFLDITSSNIGGLGTITVLINDGAGNFTTGLELPVGQGTRSVDGADLDGDSDADLAVVADDPTLGAAVIVLQNVADNAGEIAFAAPQALSVDADPNFVLAADMNGDPALDLVTVNADDGKSGGSVSVLLNTTLVSACPWDTGGDGSVGIVDFLNLLALWGTNPGGPPDFDADGVVGILDFLSLLQAWGPCPG